MAVRDKLYEKIKNNPQGVKFTELQTLVKSLGFKRVRASGSHIVYVRKDIPENIILQNYYGQAKPYQVRQVLNLIEKYKLK